MAGSSGPTPAAAPLSGVDQALRSVRTRRHIEKIMASPSFKKAEDQPQRDPERPIMRFTEDGAALIIDVRCFGKLTFYEPWLE